MINAEAFELIEQRKEEGITAVYLAKRLGITQRSAASWLSKWTRRGFLRYLPSEDTPLDKFEKLEKLEKQGDYISSEDRDLLKELRAWKQASYRTRGKAGKPPTSGRYVLGPREWGSYAHGKLEERMGIRDGVDKW